MLDACLRIAQQAPAAGNLAAQFRWLLVRDADTKAAIAAYSRETAEAAWGESTATSSSNARSRRPSTSSATCTACPCWPSPA
ncbi:MAG TPA: hypothetical protein VGL47_20410 [Amycolatopsis sp.]|uniref:hypothetical protein n=1 Tax=Amycolatopsis sp. TaxID=37632 RepID=UPI002F41D084